MHTENRQDLGSIACEKCVTQRFASIKRRARVCGSSKSRGSTKKSTWTNEFHLLFVEFHALTCRTSQVNYRSGVLAKEVDVPLIAANHPRGIRLSVGLGQFYGSRFLVPPRGTPVMLSHIFFRHIRRATMEPPVCLRNDVNDGGAPRGTVMIQRHFRLRLRRFALLLAR